MTAPTGQSDIKVGMTVQLKSGGPVMTVDFSNHNRVHCVWLSVDGKTQYASFAGEMLAVVAQAATVAAPDEK